MSNPKKTMNPFLANALAGIAKTKKQLTTESTNEFLEEARTEVTVQIAQANAEVIRATAVLGKANAALRKANAGFKTARFSVPSKGTLDGYLYSRNNAEENVVDAVNRVEEAKRTITANELRVETLESIATDLG